jgi:hypothetical protein
VLIVLIVGAWEWEVGGTLGQPSVTSTTPVAAPDRLHFDGGRLSKKAPP